MGPSVDALQNILLFGHATVVEVQVMDSTGFLGATAWSKCDADARQICLMDWVEKGYCIDFIPPACPKRAPRVQAEQKRYSPNEWAVRSCASGVQSGHHAVAARLVTGDPKSISRLICTRRNAVDWVHLSSHAGVTEYIERDRRE